MSANSTGCYSIPSCSSSHQQFSLCTRCPQLERQLEESNSEVRQLAAKLETLQHTIDQRNREIEHLENENHAIQFQVCWSGIAYIPCTELCRLIRGVSSIITCIHSQLAASVNGQPACKGSWPAINKRYNILTIFMASYTPIIIPCSLWRQVCLSLGGGSPKGTYPLLQCN